MNYFKFIYISLLLVIIHYQSAQGQPIAQLSLVSGGNIDLHFNTLLKYQNGLIPNPTVFRVNWNENGSGDFNWRLTFYGDDGDGDDNFDGQLNGNSLPMSDYFCLEASGTDGGSIYNTKPLKGPLNIQNIVESGTDNATFTITINYTFGVAGVNGDCNCSNLLGKNPDVYVFDLYFELTSDP